MNIYVGNLPYKTESDTLREVFEEFGEVEAVDVIVDRRSGRSRGYAFVTMPDENHGSEAVESLNGSELDGRNLRVDISRPRDKAEKRQRRPAHGIKSGNSQPQQHKSPETNNVAQKPGGFMGLIKKIFG